MATKFSEISAADMRAAMVDSQLRPNDVIDPAVVAAMAAAPREAHVPAALASVAYMDRAIRLETGGFLPAPLFHGALLAEAHPTADDNVLVVDAGSGYLPALVEPLVGSLDTMAPEKAANGSKRGDYTLVLVDGAIEHVPASLAKLVGEGGRIVTGMVDRGVTRLATGRKSGKALALLPLAEMGIPRLGAFDRPQNWSF